jgi:hypothetical protein
MVMQYVEMSGNNEVWQPAPTANGAPDCVEASDLHAALLLGRVESMVRNGQPMQAVNHIVEMTQVERDLAEEFINELKGRLFA